VPLDTDFLAGGLKESEIGEELIVVFGFPVNFGKVDFPGVNHIENLAVNGAGAEGLNFGDIDLSEWKRYLKEGIDPGEDFRLGDKVSFIHDAELLFLHLRDLSGKEDIILMNKICRI
jgi:hypothetical protein